MRNWGGIGSKTEAEAEAARIRAAILAGTFERAADRLARELRQTACGPATSTGIVVNEVTRERAVLHHAGAEKRSNDLLH